jgi:hypothetical protein
MSYSRFALLILRRSEVFSAKVAYNYGVLFPDPEITLKRPWFGTLSRPDINQ